MRPLPSLPPLPPLLVGRPRPQRDTVRGLGLKRIGHVVVKDDRPEIRGMIFKVSHLVEVEDYQAMRRKLADHPANVPWQARMADLLDVPDDYSGDDLGIGKVWELP